MRSPLFGVLRNTKSKTSCPMKTGPIVFSETSLRCVKSKNSVHRNSYFVIYTTQLDVKNKKIIMLLVTCMATCMSVGDVQAKLHAFCISVLCGCKECCNIGHKAMQTEILWTLTWNFRRKAVWLKYILNLTFRGPCIVWYILIIKANEIH